MLWSIVYLVDDLIVQILGSRFYRLHPMWLVISVIVLSFVLF